MGAELDLDDCAANSNKAVAELAELRTELAILKVMIDNAPKAVSAEADFQDMTWLFEIEPGTRVGAGTYALVRMPPNAELRGRPLADGPA